MTNRNNNNNFISSQMNNNKLGKNNTFEQKSVKDSKSLNVVRNRSNTNCNNNDNNIKKKLINSNNLYKNNFVKTVTNKDNIRHFSVKQNNNIRNSNLKEYSLINNKLNITNKVTINNFNINNEIDENKIKQNISNNSLNTYSIFIPQKYYKDKSKIGLKKIRIFDINDNEVPIIFYQTNADFDNGRLFNTTMTNLSLFNKSNKMKDDINNNNIPFITDIEKDIYIYFHINNNQSNNIKYIQIINYSNKNNTKMNPVKNIEIYKNQSLIYKGKLNDDINIISFSHFNNGYHYNSLNDTNNIYQERPLSTSQPRTNNNFNNKMIQYDIDNNYKNNKNITDVYHTARNNLIKRLSENVDDTNYNQKEYNNIKLFNKTDEMNINENSIKKNNKKSNTINIHINNNTNNITNLEFIEKTKKQNGSYTYIKQNTSENNQFNCKENNINNNENKNDNNNFINNNDNILMTSVNKKLDMTFDKTNSENEYNETDIFERPQTNIITDNQLIKDNNCFEKINILNQNLKYENSNLYNTVFNRNSNYICFNKIKFVITSNYGHKKYVGLTGIKLYNIKGDLINVETADSIGALPKDLRTIFNDEYDNRIFENVFNEEYNTNDADNMWVTKLKKGKPKTFIELVFKEKIKISKIKFYNYNEKKNLHIGAKTIELYLDDNYYGTIYLRPGVGERACSYIKTKTNTKDNDVNNVTNDNEDESDNYKDEDFGQIITFPIKNVEENKNDKFEIKYASFLYDEQCYETPFMPSGYYIKFEFLSNHYKGKTHIDEAHIFKYTDIGLDSIEIYDNNNSNIISDKSMSKYKIITNCEKVLNTKNKLILNGTQNENGYNCIFYMFEQPFKIAYIKFNPLTKKEKYSLNSVKEIKIYCESNIIFEGCLYLEHPTIVLFTCDLKITKNINKEYLTQKINVRESYEIKKNDCISLILN